MVSHAVVRLQLLTVMLQALATSAAAPPDPPPTIAGDDGSLCALCRPGTHMRAPCTRTVSTDCAPCPDGYYTQYWNFLPHCLPCQASCSLNQRERHRCAPTRDRECECAPGYYWRAEQCVRHTSCGPGRRVRRNGTTHTDTECMKCPRGTFSLGNSTQCTPHTGCSGSLSKVLQGTSWHDDVCASCSELRNEGGAAFLRGILPTFFHHEKLKVGKLKRLVRLLGIQTWQQRSASSKQDLLHDITMWTGSAEDQHLWKLPKMLGKIKLKTASRKLKQICEKFQYASNCK